MHTSRLTIFLAALWLRQLASAAPAKTVVDRFGIAELYATRNDGVEWQARWDDSQSRRFANAVDPRDSWFDTDHGDGAYTIDGRGVLTAAGPTVRMYVHDPARLRQWNENLEITVYVRRRSESQLVSYSGLQIFARTNHGTIGNEEKNLADDRGYGAKVTVDGRFEFEKETAHQKPHGYAIAATTRPWSELPANQWFGVKYILRNCDADTKVRLQLYRDLTDGKGGGKWEEMADITDDGHSWGVGADAAREGIKPELALTQAAVLPASESGKPMISVYFRHEYATMDYSRASIREIDSLP